MLHGGRLFLVLILITWTHLAIPHDLSVLRVGVILLTVSYFHGTWPLDKLLISFVLLYRLGWFADDWTIYIATLIIRSEELGHFTRPRRCYSLMQLLVLLTSMEIIFDLLEKLVLFLLHLHYDTLPLKILSVICVIHRSKDIKQALLCIFPINELWLGCSYNHWQDAYSWIIDLLIGAWIWCSKFILAIAGFKAASNRFVLDDGLWSSMDCLILVPIKVIILTIG